MNSSFTARHAPPFARFFPAFYRALAKGLESGGAGPCIVAFGDSVTAGHFEHGCSEPASAFGEVLRQALEQRFAPQRVRLVNAGVGGDDAPSSLARLDADVLAARPDLVLVGFGLNDAAQGSTGLSRFRGSLLEIVTRVRDGGADVLLITPPFIADRLNDRIAADHADIAAEVIARQRSGMLHAYAAAVRDTAAGAGVVVADVHAAWSAIAQAGRDTTAMLANGLNHPDRAAHRLAASIVYVAMTGEDIESLPRA